MYPSAVNTIFKYDEEYNNEDERNRINEEAMALLPARLALLAACCNFEMKKTEMNMRGNKLWKYLALAIMAAMVSIMSACGVAGNHKSEKGEMLQGKWKFQAVQSESMSQEAQKAAADKNQISKGLQYTFSKDGELIIQQDENQMARKYRLLEKINILIMENGNSHESYHIEKLNKTELVLKDAHGTTVSFSR